MPASDPHWTAVFQALLTPAIGLGVAWIAFMQWWTNHQKYRLDLFDRRYTIYDSAKRLIGSVLTGGHADQQELIAFYWRLGESDFLLDRETSDFLSRLLDRIDEINHWCRMAEGARADSAEFHRKALAAREWVIGQQDHLLELFRRSLTVETFSAHCRRRIEDAIGKNAKRFRSVRAPEP
jgi:hypothetical protein